MDGLCTVCGEAPQKSGFFNIRFVKCPVCSSIYLGEDALVDFIQASMDNPGCLRDFPEHEQAPDGTQEIRCRQCGKEMVKEQISLGRIKLNVYKCLTCRQILLYPVDLFHLYRDLQEEKKRGFQDALSGS